MTNLINKLQEWWKKNIFRVEDKEKTIVYIKKDNGWYQPPDLEPLDCAVLSPERKLMIIAYTEAVLIPEIFENGDYARNIKAIRVGCRRRQTYLFGKLYADEIIHDEPYKEYETQQSNR